MQTAQTLFLRALADMHEEFNNDVAVGGKLFLESMDACLVALCEVFFVGVEQTSRCGGVPAAFVDGHVSS